jgi:hypothetical protein
MQITGDTTLGDLVALLQGAGCKLAGLRREGREYHATLALDESHATETVSGAEGRGGSISEAISDALSGLSHWTKRARVASARDALQIATERHLATPGPSTEIAVAEAARAYRRAVVLGD